MSERAGSWARVLTPMAAFALVAVAISVGVSYAPKAPERAQIEHPMRASASASVVELTDLELRLALHREDLDRAREEMGHYTEHRGGPAEPTDPRVPRPSAAPRSPLRAEIRAADKRHNVYIISAGAKDGVRLGMEFVLRRDGRHIGTIVIDSVGPDSASGMRAPGTPQFDAGLGDWCTALPSPK